MKKLGDAHLTSYITQYLTECPYVPLSEVKSLKDCCGCGEALIEGDVQ